MITRLIYGDFLSCILHMMPIMESSFLKYVVTGDKTFVHHMTLKTSTASLMWKQPLSPTIPDVETAIISNRKGIQSYVISEKVRVSVL
jgi:hypothetical protein